MKPFYFSLAFLICLGFTGCETQSANDDSQSDVSALSVKEAKTIFETVYLNVIKENAAVTRSADSDECNHPSIVPSDFTPQWEKATKSSDLQKASVEVPIQTDSKYFVHVLTTGKMKPVAQKLIVSKNADGVESVQLLTLASLSDIYSSVAIKNFNQCGDKAGFTGIALYNTLDGQPAGVEEYSNGEMIASTYSENGQMNPAEVRAITGAVLYDNTQSGSFDQPLWIETGGGSTLPPPPFDICSKCHRIKAQCICPPEDTPANRDQYCTKCGDYLSGGKCVNPKCSSASREYCPKCGSTMGVGDICLVCGYVKR